MAKVAINKKLCKEHHNTESNNDAIVYLNNGEEFQIQLFNPTKSVIGVKIKFNDCKNSYQDNFLVLRPGERVWLERFLDCCDKFIFNTYEVSNSTQVLEAIKDNGNFSIEFYYEKVKKCNYMENYDWQNDYLKTTQTFPDIYFTRTQQPLFEQYYNTTTCTVSNNTLNCCFTNISANVCDNKNIETGRVEHGDYSNQTFKNVDYTFEYVPFYIKNIKLLPTSRKQYSASDLKKAYCTNCGKKLSPKFKYCPACGTKIN